MDFIKSSPAKQTSLQFSESFGKRLFAIQSDTNYDREIFETTKGWEIFGGKI